MQVKEFIGSNPREIITARQNNTVLEAMALLVNHRISCLPVLNEKSELVGIISDKDIFRAAFRDPQKFTTETVGELMTTDLIVGLAEDEFDYVAGVMTKNRIRHVPIVEKNRLVGLLSLGDIVKSQLKTIRIENRYLRKYIDDQYPG